MIQPWNTSREKARELCLDLWGTPAEVGVIAAPERFAATRREAVPILKQIAKTSPFTSRSGLTARLSGRVLGKIVSGDAVNSSFCREAHFLAAVNIDNLYKNALEPWIFELNPNKENNGLKARRYLYSPLEYDGKIVVVKITVKEYDTPDLENKIYSIEALNVELGA